VLPVLILAELRPETIWSSRQAYVADQKPAQPRPVPQKASQPPWMYHSVALDTLYLAQSRSLALHPCELPRPRTSCVQSDAGVGGVRMVRCTAATCQPRRATLNSPPGGITIVTVELAPPTAGWCVHCTRTTPPRVSSTERGWVSRRAADGVGAMQHAPVKNAEFRMLMGGASASAPIHID
jgi:hypothetical protein